MTGAATLPGGVHRAADYEALARGRLPAPVFAYVAGGSGEGRTLAANREAFARRLLWPRVLCDVSDGSTRLDLAGTACAHPILLAPVAHQRLAHAQAEVETARAAAATDTCIVLSTLSSRTLEDVAAAARDGRRWFQLYLQPSRESTLDLVRRAEAAGYEALVVTVDAALQMPSTATLQAGFSLPADCIAANLAGYPAAPDAAAPPQGSRIFGGLMRTAPVWGDLEWLLANTRLPVWVKGVLHPQDALRLRESGVTGVVVSNHGGRTIDGIPASLDALPAVRTAVGPEFPLLFDGGIRSGTDVFHALAAGADAVLVGRLQVYALAVAGALGVAHMLRLLREELEICMATAGCVSLADVRATTLATPGHAR